MTRHKLESKDLKIFVSCEEVVIYNLKKRVKVPTFLFSTCL